MANNYRTQPMADNRCNQPKAEYSDEVLTDVLLFTHLVHLPAAYASKPYKYYELFTFHVGLRIAHKVCDHFKYYAMRLAFRTVRRAFKTILLLLDWLGNNQSK